MRGNTCAPRSACGLDHSTPSRWRSASIRFPLGNRLWLRLALGGLAVALSIPMTRRPPASPPTGLSPGISGAPLHRLSLNADGKTLATIDDQGHLEIRPAADGPVPGRALDVPGYVKVAAFSPDGRRLAVGTDQRDIMMFQPDKGYTGQLLGIPVDQTSDLAFSPDGRLLAVSSISSNDISLWDIEGGRERTRLGGHPSPVVIVAFASDGRSLASVPRDACSIFIWDLADGRLRRRLSTVPTSPICIAYSPGGRVLASAGPERFIRIWDVEAGRESRRLAGHTLPTRWLAFSPDGRLLATASGDGGASLWSVSTGRELVRLDARADALLGIAFSPDGRAVAAIGNDDVVRLWDMSSLHPESWDRD